MEWEEISDKVKELGDLLSKENLQYVFYCENRAQEDGNTDYYLNGNYDPEIFVKLSIGSMKEDPKLFLVYMLAGLGMTDASIDIALEKFKVKHYYTGDYAIHYDTRAGACEILWIDSEDRSPLGTTLGWNENEVLYVPVKYEDCKDEEIMIIKDGKPYPNPLLQWVSVVKGDPLIIEPTNRAFANAAADFLNSMDN